MKRLLTPSVIVLVVSNLFPLYMVLNNKWALSDLLLLYWAESGIIGFFTILRMIFSGYNGEKKFTNILIIYSFKLFFILFFIFHFGAFMLAHALFLFGLILGKWNSLKNIYLFMNELVGLKPAIVFLFLSHSFSFIWNFILMNEKEKSVFFMEMTMPYRRIMVMHITLIVGAFLTIIFGVKKSFLIVFIIMKIITDVNGHIRERLIRKKEKNLYNRE